MRYALPLLFVLLGLPAIAQDTGAAPESAASPTLPTGFEVHDVLVMLSDNQRTQLSSAALFHNTLPTYARLSLRDRAGADVRHRPMPLGIITMRGKTPDKVDVLLEINQGKPLYAWPPQTVKKDSRLLWSGLAVDDRVEKLPTPKTQNHWLPKLRGPDQRVLHANRKSEQALFYDVALDVKEQPKINFADGKYSISPANAIASRGFTLFKPLPDGKVRVITLTRAQENAPADQAEQTHDNLAAAVTAFSSALQADGLPALESQHAASVVRRYVENEGDQLTAVYRVDPAWIDQRLPLDITPAPDKVTRIALVILINADPDLVGRIDTLIAQLGSDVWSERVAADQALADLGAIAKPQLTRNRNHTDAEVAFRIESLLDRLTAPALTKD